VTTVAEEVAAAYEEWADQPGTLEESTPLTDMIVERIQNMVGHAQEKLMESLEVARERARDAEDQASDDRRLLASMTQRYHRTLELLSITGWPAEDEDRYAAIRADYDAMFAD
jgi:hypothetical protein